MGEGEREGEVGRQRAEFAIKLWVEAYANLKNKNNAQNIGTAEGLKMSTALGFHNFFFCIDQRTSSQPFLLKTTTETKNKPSCGS